MGSYNSYGVDPELDYRRQLLEAARKGKAAAREELQREYNVRVYSAAEREELHYEAIPQMKGRLSRRHLEIGTQWAELGDMAMMDE